MNTYTFQLRPTNPYGSPLETYDFPAVYRSKHFSMLKVKSLFLTVSLSSLLVIHSRGSGVTTWTFVRIHLCSTLLYLPGP